MKLSLSRLLIVIGAVFCILLLAVVLTTSYTFSRASQENAIQLRTEIMKSAVQRIEAELDDVTQTVRAFASRATVVEFATDSASQKLSKVEMLRIAMDDIKLYVPLIKSVHLILESGNQMRSSYVDGDFTAEYMEANRLFEQLDTSIACSYTQITDVLLTKGKAVMAIAVPILDKTGSYLGICAVVCDLTELKNALPDNMIAMLVGDNQMLLSNHTSLNRMIPEEEDTFMLDGQKHAVIRENIPMTGWQLVCVYLMDQWQGIALSQNSILLIVSLLMGAIATLLWLVHRMIVEPIESITRQIEGTASPKEPIVNRHRERNELTRLANGINEMTDRISLLNQDILRVNQEKYQLQLDQLSDRVLLLQTQVNPHFLYNNLECIRGMAYLGNMEGVREMAVCMAHVARYCVRGGLSTVQQELDCVRSYFRIICLRYGDDYSMVVQADEGALGQPCPRMILQPVVENAVFHGFVHAKRRSGRVTVTAQMLPQNRIRLCVQDDGVGLEPAVLAQLNQEFRAVEPDSQQKLQERIGLYNVNYRLCLLAVETEGILLENVPAGGLRTVIEFRMPQSKEDI